MVASEMFPFAKSGGLGDVLGALPPALARRGMEVSVFIPAYRSALAKGGFAPCLDGELSDVFGTDGLKYSLYRARHEGTTVYAVRCGDFFDRESFYGDDRGDFPDNAIRFCRFCRGALSAMERMGEFPDVLHCHDWQAALAPALLRTRLTGSPPWSRTAAVFTIHNLGYQGRFASDQFLHTALPPEAFTMSGVEFWGDINLMKGGIVFADVISTVSEPYAREIQTPEQGHGLEGVIASRAADLFGIMNGVDYEVWSPAKDPHIPARFSHEDMEGKSICRKALRSQLGLRGTARGPLCVMISRLASQKGVELLLATMEDLLWLDVQIAVLGTGEAAYEKALGRAAERYPRQVAFRGLFSERLAHAYFAGGDILLMPSRYEPAGLNQLYAMKYGTLPLVRIVGGLSASVVAHREIDPEVDTGFQFEGFHPAELLWCMMRACRAHEDKDLWRRLVWNAMSQDFGWDRVVPRYGSLYKAARERQAARG